ncbi:MAG: hypothetical protein LBQ01_03495, partial [Prevotellaceae bacterium]|nr:hypothetical protein [Prevotellaceae bacterium]
HVIPIGIGYAELKFPPRSKTERCFFIIFDIFDTPAAGSELLSRTGLICFIYSVLIKIISQHATVAIFRLRRHTAIILFLFTTRAQGTQRSHKELCVTFVPVVPLW